MYWETDQDADAIYAHNTARRIATNNSADESERVARSTVFALTRLFNFLIAEFECGGDVDAVQLDALGVQIAAAVGVVNEMRNPIGQSERRAA